MVLRLQVHDCVDWAEADLLLVVDVEEAELRELLAVLAGVARIELLVLILRVLVTGTIPSIELVADVRVLHKFAPRILIQREHSFHRKTQMSLTVGVQHIIQQLVNAK